MKCNEVARPSGGGRRTEARSARSSCSRSRGGGGGSSKIHAQVGGVLVTVGGCVLVTLGGTRRDSSAGLALSWRVSLGLILLVLQCISFVALVLVQAAAGLIG